MVAYSAEKQIVLYPQYFIDDLKTRADLVRIIQPYAPDLKKKGRIGWLCCPFHQEKTPSFSGQPVERVLQMLWLRQGRDGVQLRDGDGGT